MSFAPETNNNPQSITPDSDNDTNANVQPIILDGGPNIPPVRLPAKRPSMFEPLTGSDWDDLDSEGKRAKLKALQQECIRKEEEILQLIKLRAEMGSRRLPRGMLSSLAPNFLTKIDKKLGNPDTVSDRWVQKLIADYMAYRVAYPQDPSAEFFMPLPMGRPRGQQLTEEQKSIIRRALANRVRNVESATGRQRNLDVQFEYRDVWNYARAISPMPSYDTVRRYIHNYRENNPALFKLMTEGEDSVKRELLLKKRNDVSRPNERWQSDARDLPWYILHNGKPHRVCLIIIYDDYSGYIIWWQLVLKKEKEDSEWIATSQAQRRRVMKGKRTRSSTFTALDVILLYLAAMYHTGVRPERIYTDNGSQFVAAEKYLLLLTQANEPPIQVSHTRPGEPWGRGKVENSLGQLNRLLRRIPGTYNKRDGRKGIRDAMHHKDLYTFDEAEAELAKHFLELNERPRKNLPSRFELWRSVLSLPAPPIHQMALIEDITSQQKEVVVSKWSINFDGREWEPKSIEGKNQHIFRWWMDAVALDEKAWLCAIKLNCGWRVEVRLGNEWIELVPKVAQQADGQSNNEQARAMRDLREELQAIIKADSEVVMNLTGGKEPVADASTGEYNLTPMAVPLLDNPVEAAADYSVDTTNEVPEIPASTEAPPRSTVPTRRSRGQVPQAVLVTPLSIPVYNDDDELAGLPSLDEQIKKAKSEMEDG